jgi:hypothetical protein
MSKALWFLFGMCLVVLLMAFLFAVFSCNTITDGGGERTGAGDIAPPEPRVAPVHTYTLIWPDSARADMSMPSTRGKDVSMLLAFADSTVTLAVDVPPHYCVTGWWGVCITCAKNKRIARPDTTTAPQWPWIGAEFGPLPFGGRQQ